MANSNGRKGKLDELQSLEQANTAHGQGATALTYGLKKSKHTALSELKAVPSLTMPGRMLKRVERQGRVSGLKWPKSSPRQSVKRFVAWLMKRTCSRRPANCPQAGGRRALPAPAIRKDAAGAFDPAEFVEWISKDARGGV